MASGRHPLASAWLRRSPLGGLGALRSKLQYGDADGADGAVWAAWFFGAASSQPGLVLVAGVLVSKAAPEPTDLKLYLNGGSLYARTAPVAGDKLVSLSGGQLTAA